jgi:hypothetical protein
MQCPALIDWSVDDDPSGRVIARAFPATYASVDPGVFNRGVRNRAEQEMIETQPGLARVSISHIVPALVVILFPDSVRPSLFDQSRISGAARWLNQCVIIP